MPLGRASERTRLAWRRTTLAATICVLLLLRLAIHEHQLWAALVAVLGWGLLTLVVQKRIHAMPGLLRPRLLRVVVVVSVTFAVAGVALIGF